MSKFKDIPGYEGLYQASKDGLIFSYRSGRQMSLQRKDGGYLGVRLSSSGVKKNYTVHKLVMLTFVGNYTLDVNHKNGDKKDNKLENLEYCTRSENVQHSFDTGLSKKGVKHPNSKITQNIVDYIRHMRDKHKLGYSAIGKLVGLDARHVGKICRRELWK